MSVSVWSRQRGFIFMLMVGAVALGVCGLSALADEPEPAGEAGVTTSPSETKTFSLDTRGSSITDVLRVIGRAGGADIIIGPDVEGTIPAFTLTDVTVEETLDYLKAAGYIQWYKRGNAYIVTAGPMEEAPLRAALRQELVSAQLALIKARARYSSRHPAVRQLEHEVEELTAELQRDLDSAEARPALADQESAASTPPSIDPQSTPIDLLVNEGSIVDALQMLSRVGNIDIVIGKAVEGTIPRIEFRDRTLEEALWLIAQSGGYRAFKIDSVTYLISSSTPQTDFLSELGFGQAAPPPPPEPALISVKVVVLSPFFRIALMSVAAEEMLYDFNAGVTTIINPDQATVQQLFTSIDVPALKGAPYVMYGPGSIPLLRYSYGRPGYPYLPAGYGDYTPTPGGYALAQEQGIVKIGEQRSLELAWSQDRPPYYLEPVGEDTYKRVELADKEGYTIVVRPAGEGPEFHVELELTSKTLSGGNYDETMRAFVGQPTFTKTKLTRIVPLTSSQPTLVLWPGPPATTLVRVKTKRAPAWAVGQWEMTGPGGEFGLLSVKADGAVIWTSGTGRPAPKYEPHLMFGPGSIDSSGQVQIKIPLGETGMTFYGKLNPDGTATGGLGPHGMAWTATKISGPEAGQGAPPWAVGEWGVETSRRKYFTIIVLPSGTVLGDEREEWRKGRGTIDPSGQIEYRITYDYPRDIHFEGTITGTLTPERTGSGMIHEEGAAADSVSDFGAFWTAVQIVQPIPEPPAPEPVRAVPIPQTPPGPAGVAVLLEVKSPEEAVAVGAETGVATEPTSEAEPRLLTEIPLKYANPALIAHQFGGTILFTTPDSPEEAAELVRKVTPPRRRLPGHVEPVPRRGGIPGGRDPLYGGGYGGGYGVGGYGGFGAGAMGMMLPSGMDPPVAVMERNVLLVHGTQEAIDQFREILSYLDKPANMVEIAVKFVEVDITEGKPSAIDLFVGDSEGERFGPAGAPGEGITVARFGRDRFQEVLQALLDEGRAQITNEPRVTTQNNVPAEVSFSTEIPYFYATITYNQYGQRTVDYESDTVSVGSALHVIPRINEDNTITLDLEARIDEQVGTVVGPNGETMPIISSQSAYTKVRVPDGDTIVIGGLTRSEKIFAPGRPSGEEAPIIGEKFRSKLAEEPKKQLLIFVTPRIIADIPRVSEPPPEKE